VQLLEPSRRIVENAESDEAPLLDTCLACTSLCRQVTLEELQQAIDGETLVQFLVLVAQATIASIERGGATLELATDWQGQAAGAPLVHFWLLFPSISAFSGPELP
jgi:hypothetical protein